MQKQVPITRTDAVDQVFALAAGRTAAFPLPRLRGGLFLRVFDSPARETEYQIHQGDRWPGDFLIRRMERGSDGADRVRIEAADGGALAGAEQVYVITRGNRWQDTAAAEIYEEESDG